MRDGIDLSAKLLLYLVLDVHGAAKLKVGRRQVGTGVSVLAVLSSKSSGIEHYLSLLLFRLQTLTHRVVVGRRDEECCREERHFQLVGTVILGEH